MRKRMLAVGAAAAAMVIGGALPASAAQQSVVVFTAGASVQHPVFAPGIGPQTPSNSFSFSTTNAGLGGQKACVGVHSKTGVDASCALASSGTFGAGLAGIGAYCGWSRGEGDVTVSNINGDVLPKKADGSSNLQVEWPQSVGTALPLVYKIKTTGAPAGVGAVQTTGAAPDSCGFPDGKGTKTFAVTGFSVLNG